MHSVILRTFGVAAAALCLATAAQAQGRGHGKAHDNGHGKAHPNDSRGEVIEGRRVPPGLAKKGGLPPGQAKKIYRVNDGVSVLRDVLGRHGYTVTRVVPANESQYVYYRLSDGRVRRVRVSPGSDGLTFSNLSSALLREVIARLY